MLERFLTTGCEQNISETQTDGDSESESPFSKHLEGKGINIT